MHSLEPQRLVLEREPVECPQPPEPELDLVEFAPGSREEGHEHGGPSTCTGASTRTNTACRARVRARGRVRGTGAPANLGEHRDDTRNELLACWASSAVPGRVRPVLVLVLVHVLDRTCSSSYSRPCTYSAPPCSCPRPRRHRPPLSRMTVGRATPH